MDFIELLNIKIKQSRVLQYNDLINSFVENKYFKLMPIDSNSIISDKQFRLVNYKISLLQRNLFLDDNFEGNGLEDFEDQDK